MCKHLFKGNCSCDWKELGNPHGRHLAELEVSRKTTPPKQGYIGSLGRVFRQGDVLVGAVEEYEYWSDDEDLDWFHQDDDSEWGDAAFD